jgi:hypothetical protein
MTGKRKTTNIPRAERTTRGMEVMLHDLERDRLTRYAEERGTSKSRLVGALIEIYPDLPEDLLVRGLMAAEDRVQIGGVRQKKSSRRP